MAQHGEATHQVAGKGRTMSAEYIDLLSISVTHSPQKTFMVLIHVPLQGGVTGSAQIRVGPDIARSIADSLRFWATECERYNSAKEKEGG